MTKYRPPLSLLVASRTNLPSRPCCPRRGTIGVGYGNLDTRLWPIDGAVVASISVDVKVAR